MFKPKQLIPSKLLNSPSGACLLGSVTAPHPPLPPLRCTTAMGWFTSRDSPSLQDQKGTRGLLNYGMCVSVSAYYSAAV